MSYFSSAIYRFQSSCRAFQQQHPLLICALYWCSGMFARAYPFCCSCLLLTLHLFIPKDKKKILFLFFFFWLFPFLILPCGQSHEGTASGTFSIQARYGTKHYGKASLLTYACGKQTRHIRCSIRSSIPLSIGEAYALTGSLNNTTFTVTHPPYLISPSLAHRCQKSVRNACSSRIKKVFSLAQSQQFASALLLGHPLPKTVKELFREKGLSHLFVISGWHFSLCSSFLLFLFHMGSSKLKNSLVFLSLCCCLLLFPSSPSVWRTWLSCFLFSLIPFFPGLCSSLNRLGLGCILCSFFFCPLSPDFLFSFLATGGILLFFPPLRVSLLSWASQRITHLLGRKLFCFFLSSFLLSFSAQLFLALPLLYFFGSLPLDGLLFNLFFPLLVIPCFFLILLALAFPLLTPFTEGYIAFLLDHSGLQAPNILTTWYAAGITPTMITIVSVFLLLLGVYLQRLTYVGEATDKRWVL